MRCNVVGRHRVGEISIWSIEFKSSWRLLHLYRLAWGGAGNVSCWNDVGMGALGRYCCENFSQPGSRTLGPNSKVESMELLFLSSFQVLGTSASIYEPV
jgi:hypothetical protein